MIKSDLKHWVGKRESQGPLQFNYNRFCKQARENLGAKGLVGITNARGPNNALGPEYRFEEFYQTAKEESSITPLGDGRVFHDNNYDLWFVKGQEVNSRIEYNKVNYFVFNLPLNTNFNEINNESFYEKDAIKILNLPSCINQKNNTKIEFYLNQLFDGIIIHSSSLEIFPGKNKKAEDFYNEFIEGTRYNSLNKNVGAIAVSGGHRSPKKGIFQKVFSPVSVGSSYTVFPDFKEGNTLEDFNNWLRNSIQNSTLENVHKGSCRREMLFRHIPSMIVSKYFKK